MFVADRLFLCAGLSKAADKDSRRAAEAVGLFISDTIAVSTAPAETACSDQDPELNVFEGTPVFRANHLIRRLFSVAPRLEVNASLAVGAHQRE